MGVIWRDNRTDEQKREAEAATARRRAEWDEWHAANPVHVVIVNPQEETTDV